jgi:putative ATP-dependent endonuclease of the OLD family
MARICELKINNFRGVKTFSAKINKKFICLLGRGDSGKTTLLNAISFVLSPRWNLSFTDSDFYAGDINNPIIIEVSLLDIPKKLIIDEKYGLYIRGLNSDGVIYDELQDDHKEILTIKLEVGKNLEPEWHVVNSRQEPKKISATDRAKLNLSVVSDSVDSHFSWNNGSPLFSILKELPSTGDENSEVIINSWREAKEKIDKDDFGHFSAVTENVKKSSLELGVDLSKVKTTIDLRDVIIKGSSVCLHDDNIPLRLKGKGTKRLISMAIQRILVQCGGIVLVDEIEQGLEPDRVKHLVRSFKNENEGQIFITTHSSEIITELEVDDLMIVNNNNGDISVSTPDEKFQNIIRACPEAGYAKKVIVCEGKTEIGICRALDLYRKSNGMEYMSTKGVVYTDGTGNNFTSRAQQLGELGIKVCVLCDSDVDTLNPSKNELIKSGIKIFDCDDSNAIEQQVSQDLPLEGIKELLTYALEKQSMSEIALRDSISSKYTGTLPVDYKNTDTSEIRKAIGVASKAGEWFKRIDYGEFLGEIIFKYFKEMNDKKIKNQLESLSDWIDA